MGKDAQIKAYLLLYVQQDDTNVKKKKKNLTNEI